MGSMRFEPRHFLHPQRSNNQAVRSTVISRPVFTMSSGCSGKNLINNESTDSGVTSGYTPSGSPTSGSSRSSHFAAVSNESTDETNNVHQYIIDRSEDTTYIKGKFLGKGGSAHVYELTDLLTGQVYAGKIIPKSRITKPHHKEKITREIELHRNLIHVNVVRYYHSFEDSENFYIILEKCSKKSLMHVMKHRKILTEPEVRFYLRQLIEGLRYVHESQIVHRDLKLGNMFLSENMTVKIGDFGLATQFHAESEVTMCGTPNYIAPEVLDRQGHDYKADLWGVGCIMYAMLVGHPPFETSSLNETYSRIAQNMYIIPQWVSRPARSLIRQLLAPNPADRLSLEQVLNHDFFTSGFIPTSLPPSSCYKSPTFGSNDSGIKSDDADSTNENITPLTTHLESIKISNQRVVTGSQDSSLLKQKSSDDTTTPAAQQSLYSALDSCLNHVVQAPSNPIPVACNPLFISKWIDYSNKYGFGFQLSDGTVGVIFNDNTRISYPGDRKRLDFQDATGVVSNYNPSSVLPLHLVERLNLLRYFTQFMDENLTEGGDNQQDQTSFVHMKRWVRTPKAIIMQLDNNTLQINFFKDHTKIILSADPAQSYWATYVNSDRLSATYRLDDISQQGCESTLHQRLVFALTVLREFAELDGGDNI